MKKIFFSLVFVCSIFFVAIYLVYRFLLAPIGVIKYEDLSTFKKPKYNSEISALFHKPYTELTKELLLAEVIITNPTKKTLYIIRDKKKLVQIVQEFDKLQSSAPKRYNFKNIKQYLMVIRGKDFSKSYVFLKNGSRYYAGSPALKTESGNMVLREMPQKLINLLGLYDLEPPPSNKVKDVITNQESLKIMLEHFPEVHHQN